MRIFIILIMSLILGACAKAPKASSPPPHANNAQIALAEAATSVSHSLVALDATEQAAYPPVSISVPPNPATYGMNIPATLNWDGPVGPVVKAIAQAANYRFKVLGVAPSAPIVVAVHEKNSNLGFILRNIGLQCKKRAQVAIFPSSRTIELRYLESA